MFDVVPWRGSVLVRFVSCHYSTMNNRGYVEL